MRDTVDYQDFDVVVFALGDDFQEVAERTGLDLKKFNAFFGEHFHYELGAGLGIEESDCLNSEFLADAYGEKRRREGFPAALEAEDAAFEIGNLMFSRL